MYDHPPAPDEVEVTLFGPGYGEAVAVHLGDGRWVLVDSCIDPDLGQPASLHYLRSLGVDSELVRAIVASHWHDDHVRGISALIAAYPKATFYLSGVFDDLEAMAFLAAYSGREAKGQTAGTKELYEVVDGAAKRFFTYQRVVVLEEEILDRVIRVTAFSPTQKAQVQSLLHMSQYIPSRGGAINHAPELSPNLEAIVLHVDFGFDAVLLGSDLENRGALGWSEIVEDDHCASRRKSSLYKIAHHGSITGDSPRIWGELLLGKPIAALTPFNNGGVHLPRTADKTRIKKNVSKAYLTSNASTRPLLPSGMQKRMLDMCKNLRLRNSPFGIVRARKKIKSRGPWKVDLFGRAAAM